MKEFCYEKIGDSEYYADGCIAPHSDHIYYRNLEELSEEKTSYRYSLNGLWKFHYAKNYEESVLGFEKEEYSCKNWDFIRVPAHIQMEGYDVPQYVNIQYPWEGRERVEVGANPKYFNPVASYVKHFVLPEEMQDEKIYLALDGAESAVAVWLNGVFIGYHEDSFTPAEFLLSPAMKKGENKLALQVFKWCSGSWCEDQDFFRFSGLYRDVYLYSVPNVHLQDLKIKALPSEDLKKAKLNIVGKILGTGIARIRLLDGSVTIFEKEILLKEENCILADEEIETPKLWSSEKPYLYKILIEICNKDKEIIECIEEKIGFRRIEIKNSIIHINGKRIVFNGVNRHEFGSLAGRVLTKEETEKDLCIMKQNNINAIRTSHYPNSSMLYRLCDIYGLYVIDEMNLETHGTWENILDESIKNEILPKDNENWKNLLLSRAEAVYERDKNHPSVLIWSCGNESYGGKVIHQVSDYFRNTDKTRLIHYEGIFHDRSYSGTSDIESQMYTPVEKIKEYLSNNKDKPFICCEYGHAMGNSCGAIHKYADLAEKEPLYQGGFIWDYIDQSLSKKNRYGQTFQAYGGDFGDRPTDYNFSGNGIVCGEDREPSPKMQEVKYVYQPIGISFEGQKLIINNKSLFTNTNEFECKVTLEKEGTFVEGKILEIAVSPLQKASFEIPFVPKNTKGEYCLTVSFCLKKDTIWAKAGHEVAFGQYTYGKMEEPPASRLGLECIRSPRNIGVKGCDFEVLFSALHGGLVSYKYGGKEMFEKIPRPNFWRAPTDNDMGNMMPSRYAKWKLASDCVSTKFVNEITDKVEMMMPEVVESENCVKLTFTYCLFNAPNESCKLQYEVYGDGKVVTNLVYAPKNDVGDMPEFGMLFTMNADYEKLTWYGLGPEETYTDRKSGGKLGLYKNSVKDNLSPYLVPQECGNKEEVRYALVTDKLGRGIRFEAEDKMCFSALPYTPNQLQEAMHPYELPPIHQTVIKVAKAQMGIGGDDSWGARTHEEYLLPKNTEIKFRFSFKGI